MRNFVVSSYEPCRAINSGMFPFFESVKGGGCPRTPLISGKSEDGGHQSGGSLTLSEQT